MKQTTYTYQTPQGVAGSLVDISPKSIDSRTNEETTVNALRFGMGAMVGSIPGTFVLKPTAAMNAKDFDGVVMTGFTQQMTMEGDVQVHPAQTVGVLRWGRAWVRVADGVSPKYNDPLYLVTNGANAGLFTNADPGAGNGIAVKGRFYGGLGSGNIAPAEIHNQLP